MTKMLATNYWNDGGVFFTFIFLFFTQLNFVTDTDTGRAFPKDFVSCAPDGVPTSALWLWSPTFYQWGSLSHSVTLCKSVVKVYNTKLYSGPLQP